MKASLREKGIQLETACVVCGNHEETIDHVFFFCLFSTAIWMKLFPGLQRQSFDTIDSVRFWEEILMFFEGKQMLEEGLYTLWMIWSNRNDCLHYLKCRNPINLGILSTKLAEEFKRSVIAHSN